MLVACRLAGLSALEGHYAGLNARAIRADAALLRALRAKGSGAPEPAQEPSRAAFEASRLSPASRSKLGLLGRFGAPQPRPSEAGGGLRVRRLAPRRRPGREAKLLSLSPRSDAQSRPSSIPSLGDGVMLGAAWIDRPVDTQGRAPCFHVLLSAAWKHGHAQANDRHSSRVFATPPRGFARTIRNG